MALDDGDNEGFNDHASDDILPNDIPTALADDPTVDSSFVSLMLRLRLTFTFSYERDAR